MFLFRSCGCIQSLAFFEPSGFSVTLQTIELTYSLGLVTRTMMACACILSNSALYKGRMWTGTVLGAWMTGTGLPWAAAWFAGLSLDSISAMFTVIIPSSCTWAHSITDGFSGAYLILNLVLIDLSLNVTFKSVAPMFFMVTRPYSWRM